MHHAMLFRETLCCFTSSSNMHAGNCVCCCLYVFTHFWSNAMRPLQELYVENDEKDQCQVLPSDVAASRK